MSWLLALLLLLTADAPSSDIYKKWLTPEQAENLFEKLAERKPFLASDDANAKETMNLFFSTKDYALLKGNPVFGYWHAGEFRWTGGKVAWRGVVSKGPRCKVITAKAWNAAFNFVARKHGFEIDENAPMRMQGSCVYAVADASKSEPVRGVVMEMRIDSPTGVFRYRYSRGNPTLEGAVGASIELPILLAQKINQGDWPKEK